MKHFMVGIGCLLSLSQAWASTQTLVDSGQGRWGVTLAPELRVNNQGLGYRFKLSALHTNGDHGLELGLSYLLFDSDREGEQQSLTFVGLVLGYRYLPYMVGHLDSELTLGQVNLAYAGNESSAYAAELATAWKVNVNSWLQVGAGVAVLLSAKPESPEFEPLQDLQARVIVEFGRF